MLRAGRFYAPGEIAWLGEDGAEPQWQGMHNLIGAAFGADRAMREYARDAYRMGDDVPEPGGCRRSCEGLLDGQPRELALRSRSIGTSELR